MNMIAYIHSQSNISSMAVKSYWSCLAILVLSICFFGCFQGTQSVANFDSVVSNLNRQRVMLPNGWSLSPAGKRIALGDMPLNLVVSPKGNLMAITNNGQSRQSIILIDPATEKILDDQTIRKSWYGLVFNNDGTRLYASGGNDNRIIIYNTLNQRLEKSDSIILGKPWPVKISPTGLALDENAHKLYIATKEDSALYVADLENKSFQKIPLGHEAYACLLTPDRKTLYVSLWGGDEVAVFDPSQMKVTSTIPVGSNPNEMVMTRNGKYLFVAHANDNAVSVIETSARKVMEVFTSSVIPESLAGSTPNALALSEDETKLYIANADNNCLAVFDVSEPGDGRSMGFIPTDWYPASVKTWDGKLWIANGKGSKSMANPRGPNPYKQRTDSTQYIGGLFKGSLTIVPEPDEQTLKVYTAAVFRNTPYTKERETLAEGEEANPIPRKKGGVSPIRYVFYIVKENRTYDQMLGDMKEGNGDSSLCLFPESVTPNHHALAREFVLLDNFYVNAEVSADGHNWSMAAYANDYVEKTWPTNYGGRGGTYDYEGSREIAYPKDGFIWDYCARAAASVTEAMESLSITARQRSNLWKVITILITPVLTLAFRICSGLRNGSVILIRLFPRTLCRSSVRFAFQTTTRQEQDLACRPPGPWLRKTIWPWAGSSSTLPTARSGRSRRSSCWRTTPRTAPTTWTRIGRSLL